VPLPAGLVRVELLRRVNRFALDVREAERGGILRLHLPNSGRMEELLTPGAQGLAHLRTPAGGKTAGTLLVVRHGDRWVGVDAGLPNRLFAAALAAGDLAPFHGCTAWRREVAWADQRLDFLLSEPGGTCLVEVKSCNRVDGGVALFPDAPTPRGARHLRLLARSVAARQRAAVVWFVQRDDAERLRPFREADPDFARAAQEAARAGVELYAYRCRVSPETVTVAEPIPVEVA
jgi:sugar fermentation stimulation protein A